MKTILATAYAINPYKGSEDGTGWNYACQIARFNQLIIVTRKNNKDDIEKYQAANPEQKDIYDRIQFLYFDWPKWTLFWKKGPLLSMIYYYCWQLNLAFWLKSKKLSFDICHNLNFHSDWAPSFLWILNKPFVWGPVGHHTKIKREYILPVYGFKELVKDRFLWLLKLAFWWLDPFLYLAKAKADKIICINSEVPVKMRVSKEKVFRMPTVAAEKNTNTLIPSSSFTVLSVGRFVPLKGFDLTINAFSAFYKTLSADNQQHTKLVLIGNGPNLPSLRKLIIKNKIEEAVTIIPWMPRAEVMENYKNASVFLFPSHEGAGMVVPEALSYGLPVVCLDNEGPGELIHRESTLRANYSYYESTISSLARRLDRLYTDKAFYKRESDKALAHFRNELNWDVKGDLLAKLYEEVLENRRAAAIDGQFLNSLNSVQ